jgi:hypothetical protein
MQGNFEINPVPFDYNRDMETQKELARRLVAGLEQLPARSTVAATAEATAHLADLTNRLYQQLMALPAETRRLVHTADSGFAFIGTWVDEAIEAQNQQIQKLVRATGMVATWHGSEGAKTEQVFVVRGNIRGWAHRWRKEDKGTAQVGDDPGFTDFASGCLIQAGIDGDHTDIIEKALRSDWRTCV